MAQARVSEYVLEVLIARASLSPTTPSASNIGVSQYVLEALIGDSGSSQIVSQYVVEALVKDLDTALDPPDPTSGGQHVYGHAS